MHTFINVVGVQGKVLKTIPVPLADQVAFEEGWLWVLTSPRSSSRTIFLPSAKHPGTIRRIDPGTDKIVGTTLPVEGLQPISLAAGSGALWVADYQGGYVTRIDLNSQPPASPSSTDDVGS